MSIARGASLPLSELSMQPYSFRCVYPAVCIFSVHVPLQGQVHAAWKHKVGSKEAATIAASGVPLLYIHGRHDLVATPRFAERLAARMQVGCRLPQPMCIYRKGAMPVWATTPSLALAVAWCLLRLVHAVLIAFGARCTIKVLG